MAQFLHHMKHLEGRPGITNKAIVLRFKYYINTLMVSPSVALVLITFTVPVFDDHVVPITMKRFNGSLIHDDNSLNMTAASRVGSLCSLGVHGEGWLPLDPCFRQIAGWRSGSIRLWTWIPIPSDWI